MMIARGVLDILVSVKSVQLVAAVGLCASLLGYLCGGAIWLLGVAWNLFVVWALADDTVAGEPR